MMNLTVEDCALPPVDELDLEDKWVLSRLNKLIRDVTANLDSYELGVASANVYDFIWDIYCDWYIELTKTRLTGEDARSKENAQQVLCYVGSRCWPCCIRSCRLSPRRSGRRCPQRRLPDDLSLARGKDGI